MENGKQPINAIVETSITAYGEERMECSNVGLTKREYFAGLAMQGMLADPNASNFKPPFIAGLAVDFSDALLKELDKTKQQDNENVAN